MSKTIAELKAHTECYKAHTDFYSTLSHTVLHLHNFVQVFPQADRLRAMELMMGGALEDISDKAKTEAVEKMNGALETLKTDLSLPADIIKYPQKRFVKTTDPKPDASAPDTVPPKDELSTEGKERLLSTFKSILGM